MANKTLDNATTMIAKELGAQLAQAYKNAELNNKVRDVILFGIRHYKQLEVAGVKNVIEVAMQESKHFPYDSQRIKIDYKTELAKGVKLGYVATPRRR
jgi:hypothetical protein